MSRNTTVHGTLGDMIPNWVCLFDSGKIIIMSVFNLQKRNNNDGCV